MWFATNGGVSKFDGATWTTYTPADGLAGIGVRAVAVDQADEKWFGTTGGGVSRFNGATWTTYNTVDGLPSNYISTITIADDNTVWVGTGDGVSHFDGAYWTTYTTADGLLDNAVYAIDSGNDAATWLGTLGGASRLTLYANASVPGSNFVHTTAVSNVAGDYTVLDNPLTNNNPNANILAIHNSNPGGGSGGFHNYVVGVWYKPSSGKWNIFNEDGSSAMPTAVPFNVLVPDSSTDTFVHTASAANTTGNYTLIDHSSLNGDPNAMLLVTQNWNPGGSPTGTYNNHPIGVWYSQFDGQWSVFNQDYAAMPDGAAFNVTVPPAGSDVFVHTALPVNTIENTTYIDHPLTNNRPGAVLLVTQNWNPNGRGGTYNNHPIGVFYDAAEDRWAVFNEDHANIPANAAFNVAVILQRIYLPVILR